MEPFYRNQNIELFHGNAMELLAAMPDASYDAVITDPPYSSGGTTASQRRQDPVSKYCHNGNPCDRPTFAGDAKDQRSFTWWTMAYLSECRRILKDGAYCLVFTDWRQLPATTDAFQAADLTWRGIIAWDKGRGSRSPHRGYARHQCEYIVWGTKGACKSTTHGGPWAGCHHVPHDLIDKHHITGKPVALMRELVKMVPPGGKILDPFAGSGTTLLAAELEGRAATGFEREPAYLDITKHRLAGKLSRPNPPDLAV